MKSGKGNGSRRQGLASVAIVVGNLEESSNRQNDDILHSYVQEQSSNQTDWQRKVTASPSVADLFFKMSSSFGLPSGLLAEVEYIIASL